MPLTQREFCQILSKLSEQRSGALAAANAARYGLGRLAGAVQMAQRRFEDEVQSAVPRGISIPVDTNLYTQLITICPGLLPPLPTDVARAAIAVSALQALIQSNSPGDTLNTMLGNPLGRYERIRDVLSGVSKQVKAIADGARSGAGIKVPGVGEIADQASELIKNEAQALATHALFEALEKAGVSAEAAQRCTERLCAVGVSYNPPG